MPMSSSCRFLGFASFAIAASLLTTKVLGAPPAPKDLKLVFDAKTISNNCAIAQKNLQTRLDTLAKLKVEDSNFKSVVVFFEDALSDLTTDTDPINFMKYVSTDEAARKAGNDCENDISKLILDIFAREDIFTRFKYAADHAKDLDAVDQRLLDEYMKDFKDNGLELAKDKRSAYLEKRKQIVKLESDFQENLMKSKEHLEFTKKELDGAPEDFLHGLEKTKAGKYKITMSYPHVFGTLENVKVSETRRKIQYMFSRRGGDKNVKILEQTIALRDECAKMLGYKNHAEYILTRKMAKSPEAVYKFLNNVKDKLLAKGKGELAVLVDLKGKDTKNQKIKNLDAWDYRYYDNMLKKQSYQVDSEAIKPYFPLQTVVNGMFEIYQTLLNVKFVEVTAEAKTWHKDVHVYQVYDKDSGQLIAYFMMDLFPRDNKYTHAAAFTLAHGRVMPDGSYKVPMGSIVANFNAPTSEQPSLLLHDEVETLFHEFGHIMHQTLTKSKYAAFAGTNVKRDFVEAPSQMLENWVWQPETLTMMSGHFKNPAEKLPKAMIDKLIAAKRVNVGLHYLRQLTLAYLDMEYHTRDKVNSTEVYARLAAENSLVPIQKGTIPQASFGHLMGGYDAGYYGYMWSEVYAEDMASRFKKEGWLSPKVGKDYRTWILEPGGSMDPNDLLVKFLGRAPKEDAFLEKLGLQQ